MTAPEAPNLIPSHLRVLHQAWQGRVHAEPLPRSGGIRFTIDSKPASVETECIVATLLHDRYVEHRLTPDEEWASVTVTEHGESVLASLGADRGRFADLTSAQARALADGGQS